jgi:hypothetical protein
MRSRLFLHTNGKLIDLKQNRLEKLGLNNYLVKYFEDNFMNNADRMKQFKSCVKHQTPMSKSTI